MMPRISGRLLFAIGISLCGCALTPPAPVANPVTQNESIRQGIAALSEKKYSQANEAFNEALRLHPDNAAYHYLNGLAYHLRAERGETALMESAEVGYQVALRLDPRLYWAAAELAQIRMSQKKYGEAADKFAHALLFESEDPTLWLGLSAAAYYAHDLTTANSAIQRAEKLAPKNLNVQRASAVIQAAVGNPSQATGSLEKLREEWKADFDVAHLEKRLRDWDLVHRRVALAPKAKKSVTDAASDSAPESPSEESTGAESKSTGTGSGKMCTIDVVMIESAENHTSRKGVNLLNGLTAQFNGSGTFGSTFTKTSTDPSLGASIATGDTQSITSTITVPAVTYNLNIFNDGRDSNEILARPTLVALDGESSEFFSGGTLKVGLQGVAGSQGTVQDLPVGVRLKVTPNFLPKNQIKLSVETSRESPDLSINTSTFQQSLQTSKTTVVANVVMNLSDTLILSGLSDKETSTVREGVPLLKDIPLIQYFFSSERKVSLLKSVLILLTPRREQYAHAQNEVPTEANDPRTSSSNLGRLQKKYDWFKPEQNLTSFLRILDNSDYFTEFRTGDIRTENWDTSDSLAKRIRQTLDFLYY